MKKPSDEQLAEEILYVVYRRIKGGESLEDLLNKSQDEEDYDDQETKEIAIDVSRYIAILIKSELRTYINGESELDSRALNNWDKIDAELKKLK